MTRAFGVLFWGAAGVFCLYLAFLELSAYGVSRPRSWIAFGTLLAIAIGYMAGSNARKVKKEKRHAFPELEGVPSIEAEAQMTRTATLVDIYSELRFRTRFGTRRFRVAQFDMRGAELYMRSLDGRIVECELVDKK